MMKKYLFSFMASFLLAFLNLQAQTSCTDLNGYVDYKNVGMTGGYTLSAGSEELAAQTYHYSGPGKITSVRVYGDYPGSIGGVALTVSIYNVDANGRPTSTIESTNDTWWWYDDNTGYITVNFGGGGVFVDDDFAVGVSLRNAFPWGTSFSVDYTGDGEGLGQDLASLAGTSTGFNWSSAMTNFNKNGDFYLIPRMTHFITADFSSSTQCASVGTQVAFTNSSLMSRDSMFNTIGLAGYTGSNEYYTWNFGDGSSVVHTTNASHAYSTPGKYTVTLTSTLDGWNSNCSDTYSMYVSVGLGVSAGSITNVSCNGGNNGSAIANGTGGASPYEYSLDGVNFDGGVNFGQLTAGTYNLWVRDDLGCTAMTSFTITEPSAINWTSTSSTNASCGGQDGSITVAAAGGSGVLMYKIDGGLYQSSGSFTGLSAGSYTITVKDANNCTKTTVVTVEDAGGPSFTYVNWSNVSCNGYSDGSINMMASGGSGNMQYSINNGASFQSSGLFPNLPAGVYIAIVKDAAQCTDIRKITITEPPQLSISATSAPVACHGGSDGEIMVISATGGTGSLSYSVNGTTYQSGTHFMGLQAGNYTVYVRDVANCTATVNVVVTEPTAVSATVTHTNATCNGSVDGSITAVGSGGVGGYSYSLDGSEFQTSGNFTELAAGTYTVYVMDENGCIYSTSMTVGQPSPVTATVSTTNSTCGNSNGGILVIAGGGSGSGYQYSLDGNTFFSNGAFSNLASGTYYVRVKDGNNCELVVVATVHDSNGPSITSTSHTNISCNEGNDGTITVNTVTGGTGQLQYSINGINFQTSTMFTGLTAGTYTIIVRDANGCQGTAVVTLTEPAGFVINTSVSNVSCYGGNDGSMTVTASGGAGNFAYSIDGLVFQSSTTFTGLFSGTYTVTVRDAGGCYGTAEFTVDEPTSIEVFYGSLNVSCHGANDGSINVSASGGTGILQYSLDGNTYQLSNTFNGLSGGTYTIYVQDGHGCIETSTVTITEPSPLALAISVINVSCFGGDDGVINLNVIGGTPIYGYAWSNGETDEDIFHLAAGTYSVTVTDENGCSDSLSYAITQPASPIVVNGTTNNATSGTATDGSIDITVNGGNGPYTFSWSNGATTEDLNNVAAGIYIVMVTDASGCSVSGVYYVGITTGVIAQVDDLSVVVYPNPATQSTIVATNGEPMQRIVIYNMVGQVVKDLELNANKAEIDLTGLSLGNYVVKVKVNESILVKRLEVIR